MPRCQVFRPLAGKLAPWSEAMLIALFLLACGLISPAGAAEATSSNPSELNPASVSAFADATISPSMIDGKIPGAVFVVVRDDQVICEKAFGVTGLKMRAPVSLDQTLFRVASISKILTAACILQLACAHRLDLQINVNSYLRRFRIAPAFGEPITIAELMTHSGGFDNCQFGYAAHTAADKLSLGDYLARYQPARVRPPGLFSVYDNYGYALAGYLVQKVSGMPFAKYAREQILHPLGMSHSSFLPKGALRRELATGYWLDGASPRPVPADYVNITPAAGLCTSGSDMADFLVALLADQRPDGSKMFPASVLRGLETRQFAAGPQMPGRCYGFNRISLAGRTALQQTGQWPGFNSVLLLFPKAKCGVFLAYNLCDYLQLERNVIEQFTQHFIPPDFENTSAKPLPARQSVVPLLGSYLSARTPHDTPALGFPREIEVIRSRAGNLEIEGERYRAIGPRTFEKIATNRLAGRRVMFLVDDGAIHLITQNGAYRRVDWAESKKGRLFLLWASTCILLSAVVLWPIMAFSRFLFRKPEQEEAPFPRNLVNFSPAARVMAFTACALALWFEISFVLARQQLRPFAMFYGFPAPLKHLLWVLPVLILFLALLLSFCVLAWRRRIWHLAHRLHYTSLVAALGLFVYLVCSLHLLAGI